MKIVNAMFGRGLGGIEQAFVDYAAYLKREGHTVMNMAQPDAKILDDLWPVSSRIARVRNFGWWDYLAVLSIRRILTDFRPDAIITHGNRAFTLLSKANSGHCPVIGVVHNYKFRKMLGADGFFCITEHLQQNLISAGVPAQKIFKIPNMINTESGTFNFPGWEGRKPVIGAMGRFVKKKGFEDFITMLAILKSRKIEFSAIMAGSGEEEENLKEMAERLGLAAEVKFPGWVKDKKAFFDSIDIFCLPSLHEPFGIVLLEAMAYGKPVASSDSEGPLEIIRDEESGFFFKRGDVESMASVLEKLIKNQKLAEWIADGGYKTVRLEYDSRIVGRKISEAVGHIVNERKRRG